MRRELEMLSKTSAISVTHKRNRISERKPARELSSEILKSAEWGYY